MAGRKPGTPKTGGRKKGTPNKITATVKTAIEKAFDEVGGHKWLVKQASENPNGFMTLLGKLLPTQITGEGGGPVQVATIDASKLSDAALQELLNARRATSESS